jgi:hypothetical protein
VAPKLLTAHCPSADERGGEGERSKDKEMIVLCPAYRRETSHGYTDDLETPVVQRAERRVPTAAFPGDHGCETSEGGRDAGEDVDAEYHQKGGRVGWDRDPSHHDRGLIHLRTLPVSPRPCIYQSGESVVSI